MSPDFESAFRNFLSGRNFEKNASKLSKNVNFEQIYCSKKNIYLLVRNFKQGYSDSFKSADCESAFGIFLSEGVSEKNASTQEKVIEKNHRNRRVDMQPVKPKVPKPVNLANFQCSSYSCNKGCRHNYIFYNNHFKITTMLTDK